MEKDQNTDKSNFKNVKDKKSESIENYINNKENENLDTNTEDLNEVELKKTNNDEIHKQIEIQKDKYIRLYAEFDNFKKRTIKEKKELIYTAGKTIMSQILPVLDDLERAVEQSKKDKNSSYDGIKIINNKFIDILYRNGLEKIKVNIGDTFNTDIHEAISKIEVKDEDKKNKIIDIIENGYKIDDDIIRYTKVVVGI